MKKKKLIDFTLIKKYCLKKCKDPKKQYIEYGLFYEDEDIFQDFNSYFGFDDVENKYIRIFENKLEIYHNNSFLLDRIYYDKMEYEQFWFIKEIIVGEFESDILEELEEKLKKMKEEIREVKKFIDGNSDIWMDKFE